MTSIEPEVLRPGGGPGFLLVLITMEPELLYLEFSLTDEIDIPLSIIGADMIMLPSESAFIGIVARLSTLLMSNTLAAFMDRIFF